MNFKTRIWLLPIATAVIVSTGIAINYNLAAKTSSALERVQQVQYPTVEALRAMRADFTSIQENLQQAVAEGDDAALSTAELRASAYRNKLSEARKLDDAADFRALERDF